MADKKISALTASTTPLAGTEVLPIVQSGSTVKVAVSDLTAGRTVKMSNALVNASATSGAFNNGIHVDSGAGNYAGIQLTNNATGYDYNTGVQIVTVGTAGYIRNFSNDSLYFSTNGYSTKAEITAAGDLTISTSGKGISLPGGITWTSGSGSPEGVVTAPVGSLYSRSDGGLLTSLYVKQSGSGNTGWAAK